MEPLFEAKALYANDYALYNIFRIGRDEYRAELIADENDNSPVSAPAELILSKNNGEWEIQDREFHELGGTLGVEIDAFNNGYGALLGRIGVS